MRWLTVMVSTGSPPHDALKLPTRISSMCPETSQKQCYYSLAAHPEHATPRHVTRQSSQPTGCFSASRARHATPRHATELTTYWLFLSIF